MEEILKQLGFKHITGPLWQNEHCMFHITEDAKPVDIADALYSAGYTECQNQIKATLNIE